MIRTERDRSIVITTPTGSTLCSCPIQSNNTWIFPAHLMSGTFPPTTAVPTGISFTPNPTVLHFSIPREDRHFTKEEVKRATQARQFHHFLCHPNDEALKSTLDQGSLSHQTHLKSQDIDLMTCTIGKLHYRDLHITSLSPPSTLGKRVSENYRNLSEFDAKLLNSFFATVSELFLVPIAPILLFLLLSIQNLKY